MTQMLLFKALSSTTQSYKKFLPWAQLPWSSLFTGILVTSLIHICNIICG